MLGSVNTNEVQWIQLSTICALQMVQCTSRKRLFVFSPHKPYYDTILTVHDKSHTKKKKKGKSVILHIKPISDTALWNKGLSKNKTDQWWKHIQFYSIKKNNNHSAAIASVFDHTDAPQGKSTKKKINFHLPCYCEEKTEKISFKVQCQP